MKVIAQSQPATKLSYIHLAYISAQLGNRISRGEWISGQAVLGLALVTAMACGAIGAKLARAGRRGRAMKWGVVLGFFGALVGLWVVHAAWDESRSPEAAIQHIIQTRQFWALREPPIATAVEAAALTNAAAACLAADYYGLKGHDIDNPEFAVKAYRYAEAAFAHGQESRWARLPDLTNDWNLRFLTNAFEAALQNGKLSTAEQDWARDHLRLMAEQASKTGTDNSAH